MSGISIDFLLNGVPGKAHFNLQEACALKGLNPKTGLNKRWLLPNGGVPDTTIGGRRVWTRDSVLQWIDKSDSDLSIQRANRQV